MYSWLAQKKIKCIGESNNESVRELIYQSTKFGADDNFTSKIIQNLITWITGCPHSKQKPLFMINKWGHVILTHLVLFFGVSLSITGIEYANVYFFLIPIGWILVVSAERKFFLVIFHAAIHGSLFEKKSNNKLFVDILSIPIITLPFTPFVKEHVRLHHGKCFGTTADPDAQVLQSIGITTGKSNRELWSALLRGVFNPLFHFRYIAERLKANFFLRSKPSAFVFSMAHGLMIYFAYMQDVLSLYLISFLLPTVLGFQIAATIAFAGEHMWFKPKSDTPVVRWRFEITSGRFMGAPTPKCGFVRHPLPWLLWWSKLFIVYLPLRICIVPGDMPAHDYHHAVPKGDWMNALYTRRNWAESSDHSNLISETWGLRSAINNSFSSISS